MAPTDHPPIRFAFGTKVSATFRPVTGPYRRPGDIAAFLPILVGPAIVFGFGWIAGWPDGALAFGALASVWAVVTIAGCILVDAHLRGRLSYALVEDELVVTRSGRVHARIPCHRLVHLRPDWVDDRCIGSATLPHREDRVLDVNRWKGLIPSLDAGARLELLPSIEAVCGVVSDWAAGMSLPTDAMETLQNLYHHGNDQAR